jgi:DNA-binding transcriptional ArsR family regulator
MIHNQGVELTSPDREDLQLGDVLHALSDPIRLQIALALAESDSEVACGEFPVAVGKSTMSHHFKVLRDAGVLRSRYEGTRRFHALRRDDLDARFPDLLDTVLHAARTTAVRSSMKPGTMGRRGGTQ